MLNKIKIIKSLSEAVGSKLLCAEVVNDWVHPTTGEPYTTIKVHAKDLKEYFNVSLLGKHDKTEIPEDTLLDFDNVTATVNVQARNGFRGQEATATTSFKFAAQSYEILNDTKKQPENKKTA